MEAFQTLSEHTAIVIALEILEPIVNAFPFTGLPGGALKRFQARFELGKEIGDARAVCFSLGQISGGLRGLEAQTRQIRRVLEQTAPLFRSLAEGCVDQTL